ncbi:hypothetical protein RFI_06891, partial [Reticulomyxa filosa]
MNYLKRTFTTLTSAAVKISENPHGADFETKRSRYFEMQDVLAKLNNDLQLYHKLWGGKRRKIQKDKRIKLLAVKTQIFGYLLLFYEIPNEKRNIMDELFRQHQKPFEGLLEKLSDDYEIRVIAELETLQAMFPKTEKQLHQLKHMKSEWISKCKAMEEIKRTTKRNPNYLQLAK